MKEKWKPCVTAAAVLLIPCSLLAQGNLDPPRTRPEPTQKSLQEIWDQVGTVSQKSDALATAVDDLGAQNSELQTAVTDLQNDVSALQGAVALQQRTLGQQNALVDAIALSMGITLPWQISTVESEGNVGSFNSLAFTPAGYPAISYCGASSTLRYAELNGTSWRYTTVSGKFCAGTSLAFDPSGMPAIAFFDEALDDLLFATFDGMSWSTSTIDAVGSVGRYASLAFGPDGQPAIAYHLSTTSGGQATGQVKIARSNGNTWDITIVDATQDTGLYTSLAFSPTGQPAIAYRDNTNATLRYAEFDGQVWQITSVDTSGNTGNWASLAFSPSGRPAIAYANITSDTIRYAEFDGATWQLANAASGANLNIGVSLAFTPAGQPAIAYHGTNDNAQFAVFDGASWKVTTIDSTGIVGWYPSLTISPTGQPAVAYYDKTNEDLKFAIRQTFTGP